MQLRYNSTLIILRGDFQLCLGDNICLTTVCSTVCSTNSFIFFPRIHSILSLGLEFHSDFSFYQVETNKVFLRDTSVISPYSILLFGGSINIQHQVSFLFLPAINACASESEVTANHFNISAPCLTRWSYRILISFSLCYELY